MASDLQSGRRRSSLNGEGDLGLVGIESRSPSSPSFNLTQHSPSGSATLGPSYLSGRADLKDSRSHSSLSSAYMSAEEVPTSKPAEIAPEPVPKDTPSTMPHHQSIASIATITPSPAAPLASHQQAMSLEQELDNDVSSAQDDDDDISAAAQLRAKGSKAARKRANLPPPHDRLPVGEGGPRAPPRNASVRDPASYRYSGSAGGHGDLGADTMPGSFNFVEGGGPAASGLTSFLDLDSPRTSESGSQLRSVPGRRTSLHLTPSQLNSQVKASTSSGPSSSASSSPRAGKFPPSTVESSSATTAQSTAPFDREAMQRWVLSVGCVNFDLELGPDLQFLYPPLGISREERDNIAFSSFPDTSIFDDGSSVFSWRVREVPLDSSGSEPPTIKSIQDSLQETAINDETPRPSFNKAAHQKKPSITSLSAPPLSPSKSGFAPAPSANQSNARHTPDANDASPAHGHSSFHERFTHKFFPSSSANMGRQISHDRHSSTTSASSANSFDEEAETTSPIAGSAAASIPAVGITTTSSTDILAPRRAGNSTSSSYIYGYVFFRQKPDATNRRGYFQKSVVILSHLPYVGLFSEVVSRLGPLFFEHGLSMFEAFAHDIMSWPAPQPGTTLTLPLLGSLITAAIPFGQQPQNSPNTENLSAFNSPSTGSSLRNSASMNLRARVKPPVPAKKELPDLPVDAESPLLASIPSTSLFDTFREALSDLWLLWECVLLAEPILVIAPDPKAASEAVWHMLDLVRPIPYAGDFRPYFHIHDYDFKTLVTKNKPQAGTLIAATNPFFATTCGHWPNVLRVGKPAVKLIQIKPGTGSNAAGKKGGSSGPIGGGIGGGHGAGGGGPDHIPGFTSKRKRRISKDRQLLKKLQDLASSSAKSEKEGSGSDLAARTAANITMRRYFADLTERFLAPLNRYVASLVPATFDLASPSEVPKIRPFNTVDFLASLKAHGTPLAVRSRSLPTGATVRQNLYLDFLKCPNFSLWLHSRVAAAEEEQRRRYIATLIQGDVTTFGHTRGEIETIDLYSRLVEEIRLVDVQLTSPTEPGPGSRWRTDKPLVTTSATVANLKSKPLPRKGVDQADGPSGSGRNTPTLLQPTTEKRLLDQKNRLMMQLDKLCQTLPDDLQGSLRRPA